METNLLVEIGLKMLKNDCRGTSYPLYFVAGEHFPKTFLSEQSAQEFCLEWGGGEYNVASAHDKLIFLRCRKALSTKDNCAISLSLL